MRPSPHGPSALVRSGGGTGGPLSTDCCSGRADALPDDLVVAPRADASSDCRAHPGRSGDGPSGNPPLQPLRAAGPARPPALGAAAQSHPGVGPVAGAHGRTGSLPRGRPACRLDRPGPDRVSGGENRHARQRRVGPPSSARSRLCAAASDVDGAASGPPRFPYASKGPAPRRSK
jgi:hypothetical protein